MAGGLYTKKIGIVYRVAFLYYNKVVPHGDFNFAQVTKLHTVNSAKDAKLPVVNQCSCGITAKLGYHKL